MNKFSNFVVKNKKIILLLSLILLIPAIIGYAGTKTNYDILVYLPSDIETLKGQNILKDDFNMGAFSVSLVDNNVSEKDLSNLEKEIRKIACVTNVISINDFTGTTIPMEMLPKKLLDHVTSDDSKLLLITFSTGTSDEETTDAVNKIEELSKDIKVGGMSAMSLDMRKLVESQTFAYVAVAVICCLLVLMISLDSYIVPLLLLGNIGISILFNMGTNIIFGEISYITKAIAAVLQLGVTTDFSIFLYHKYEQAKEKNKNNREAMSSAIVDTFKSVIGSSLTTFVGFLALCTMDLTLGTDIGLVMAKGVLMGLICVLTIFPSLLLLFDKQIEKTKHKIYFPEFKRLQSFSRKHYKVIFVVFLILLIPAYYGNKNYNVYYKLDEALPQDLPFHEPDDELAKRFNITSPEIIILNKNIKADKVKELEETLEKVDGIEFVISPNTLTDTDISYLLPDDLKNLVDNPKYQLILMNSKYEIASNELNDQVVEVEKIVHKYDKKGIVAGEGALMKDLVTIADHDFKMVNYTSIGVIFIVMLLVLKSFGLPIVLIFAIEFAIFTNMACAYFTGTTLPFIASIVVGTIQLGATIDYAILMSTTYLDERHGKKKDKDKAMEDTLKVTVPSIITSALCFFAATIGVSLYTKIDMIGSICTLLSRGAIISMLVVILVLPSLLLVFDGLILKTTKFKKEGKSYE